MLRRPLIMIILALTAACCGQRVAAQAAVAPYKFDLGANLGMSGYIGDANSTNPFRHAGFTGDIAGRYIIDTRWALRASLMMAGLSGNTADMSNVLPDGAEFSFTSTVYDLTVRGEANFFNYGIGETYKRLRRWTPYLALGMGFSIASGNGHTAVAPPLPMDFGFKFKPKEMLNLFAECSMTKVFTDHVDGTIADLNLIKTDFYKNTDWVSRLTVGISYEFGKRCETCHYVD
ncbi:MAG: outer membrane beta-barrel protein [Muribaculaceae bacterium]|nr:outer membrane beta-barrel protein [Muribaculaceae bacterium]